MAGRPLDPNLRALLGGLQDSDRALHLLQVSGLSTPEQLQALGARTSTAFAAAVGDFALAHDESFVLGAQDVDLLQRVFVLFNDQWATLAKASSDVLRLRAIQTLQSEPVHPARQTTPVDLSLIHI